MPINNSQQSGLKAKEQQNRIQSTLDKSKGSMETIEKDFINLRKTLEELNSTVTTLRNVEILQLAGDVKSRSDAQKTREKATNNAQHTSKHAVESNARNEAGLRAIRTAIVDLHNTVAKSSKEERALRHRIASKEQNESIKKHRSIGMRQMSLLESFGISSVSGLENGKVYKDKDGKEHSKREVLDLWDKIPSEVAVRRDISSLADAFRDANDPRHDIINKDMEGVDLVDSLIKIETDKKEKELGRELTQDEILKVSAEAAIRASRDPDGTNKLKAEIWLATNKDNHVEIMKADEESQKTLSDISKGVKRLGDIQEKDKLAEKENRRESRKIILSRHGKRGRGGNRVVPKAAVAGGSVSLAANAAETLAETAVAKKILSKKVATKATVATSAAAAKKLASNKVKNVTTKKVVEKTAAVASKKATTAVATSTVKKVAAKKVAGKVGLSTIMALAKKVAAKLGWSTVAKHLATKLPALALGAAAGPFGVAIAIAGAIWMAYDIYEVLQELDKATDMTDGVNHPLLKPNEPETKQVVTRQGIRSDKVSNADVLDTVTKQKNAATQPSVDGANAGGKEAPAVVNSGNTTNSGNSTVINNYQGSFSPDILNSSYLSTRVPAEGFITPGI